MPNRHIYVLSDGKPDVSRWLRITGSSDDKFDFHLQDLCHPGLVSEMTVVSFPTEWVRQVLIAGPLQLKTEIGFVFLNRNGDLLDIEFRGNGDRATTKVSVDVGDVQNAVDQR